MWPTTNIWIPQSRRTEPMDILALAVPFFLLALLIELAIDRVRGTGYYRINDAVNSLSVGMFMSTSGYFTKLIPAVILAYVLQDFALIDVQLAWFDTSPAGLGLWLLAALGFDFCYYWSHRFGHEMSILWAQHAVHHQSEDYNLSTALRQTSSGFIFTWIFYVPLFLLGMPFEVFVTVNAVSLIYQFWVHTQHVQKLGWFDLVFVSPSNHRVHHAQNEIYIDKNYGGTLILWDRLFGTFQPELDEEPVIFGVRNGRICRYTAIYGLTLSEPGAGGTSWASGFGVPAGVPKMLRPNIRNSRRIWNTFINSTHRSVLRSDATYLRSLAWL